MVFKSYLLDPWSGDVGKRVVLGFSLAPVSILQEYLQSLKAHSLDHVPVAFFLTFWYSRNESALYRYLILITSPVLAVLLIVSAATVLTVVSHCNEVFPWRETSKRAYMAPDRARVFCWDCTLEASQQSQANHDLVTENYSEEIPSTTIREVHDANYRFQDTVLAHHDFDPCRGVCMGAELWISGHC